MSEIVWEVREVERILRYALVGDVDDAALLAAFKTIWARHPQARNWHALGDLRRYHGRITWGGVMELSRIRRQALPHGAPTARTALIADTAWYEGFVKAIDQAFYARRFRVFDTEAAALAWLREADEECDRGLQRLLGMVCQDGRSDLPRVSPAHSPSLGEVG